MGKILPCFVKPWMQKKKKESCPFTLRNTLLYFSMSCYLRSKSRQCPAPSGLISSPRVAKFKCIKTGVLVYQSPDVIRVFAGPGLYIGHFWPVVSRRAACFVLGLGVPSALVKNVWTQRMEVPAAKQAGAQPSQDPCSPAFWTCDLCNQYIKLHLAWPRQVILLSFCCHSPGSENTQK